MYELRTHKFEGTDIVSAYNATGAYIGDESFAKELERRGIIPELAHPDNKVCSVGFCEKEQKWYGWSHRAIFGFGIGSEVKKGDCAYIPANKEDFIASCLSFWGDKEYHTDITAFEDVQDNQSGVTVRALYNDTVPNEKLRGTVYEHFTAFPEKYGKGEWTAQSLDDAKTMAIDFADSVS